MKEKLEKARNRASQIYQYRGESNWCVRRISTIYPRIAYSLFFTHHETQADELQKCFIVAGNSLKQSKHRESDGKESGRDAGGSRARKGWKPRRISTRHASRCKCKWRGYFGIQHKAVRFRYRFQCGSFLSHSPFPFLIRKLAHHSASPNGTIHLFVNHVVQTLNFTLTLVKTCTERDLNLGWEKIFRGYWTWATRVYWDESLNNYWRSWILLNFRINLLDWQ